MTHENLFKFPCIFRKNMLVPQRTEESWDFLQMNSILIWRTQHVNNIKMFFLKLQSRCKKLLLNLHFVIWDIKEMTSKVVVFNREQVGSHWGKLFLKMICRHVSCLLPVRIQICNSLSEASSCAEQSSSYRKKKSG